ncbi:MAG: dTMP kinase [Rhodobacteraceae bacterium]|nr:dTMP kinase [Paracoccaceae bacterium]
MFLCVSYFFQLTFEGIDGVGKSTQARLLAAYLQGQHHDVALTREPGGSRGADIIRELLLNGGPDRWSVETEICLFTAARRDHMERLIQPALAKGRIVICDRFADSTRVYQGLSRGNLRPLVDALHSRLIGREPDLTLLLDMDPQTALARALDRQATEHRFEHFGVDMQVRIRAGFLALAKEFDDRVQVVNGNQSDIRQATKAAIARKRAKDTDSPVETDTVWQSKKKTRAEPT